MKQKLPVSDFKFVPVGDNTETWIENLIEPYTTESDIGYILEVDLEYPESLHDLHNDYPLAPEHLQIGKVKKLFSNLMNKQKYIVHIDNLKFYLSKGMKLTKIHRIVSFKQKAWLASYIDHNTNENKQLMILKKNTRN